MPSSIRESAERDYDLDLHSIKQKISEHFHDVVKLFETCLGNCLLSAREVKDLADEHLHDLKKELARLTPSETSVSEICFTRDPLDYTNEELCYLNSATNNREFNDLPELWPDQRQNYALDGSFNGLYIPSNSSAPIAAVSSRSYSNGNHDNFDNNEMVSPSLRQDPVESSQNLQSSPQYLRTSYGHPSSAHTTQCPSQNTNKGQMNRSRRTVRCPSSFLSQLDPDSRSLYDCLSPTHLKHARVLTGMFAAAGNLETLSHFVGALKYLKSHQAFRLPPVSSGFAALFRSLENLEGAHFAFCLQRRVGLIRVLMYRNQIFQRIENNRESQLCKAPGVGRRNMISSETLDRLVREFRLSSGEEDEDKVRIKIQNHLSASRSWWNLRNVIGLGALAIFPQMASSS